MIRGRARGATSPEYESMKSCSQLLRDTFALHPERVKDALLTNELITWCDYKTALRGDKGTAIYETTLKDDASILVYLVLERVREHPELFLQFVVVFESLGSRTDILVKQFNATYAETKGEFTLHIH